MSNLLLSMVVRKNKRVLERNVADEIMPTITSAFISSV